VKSLRWSAQSRPPANQLPTHPWWWWRRFGTPIEEEKKGVDRDEGRKEGAPQIPGNQVVGAKKPRIGLNQLPTKKPKTDAMFAIGATRKPRPPPKVSIPLNFLAVSYFSNFLFGFLFVWRGLRKDGRSSRSNSNQKQTQVCVGGGSTPIRPWSQGFRCGRELIKSNMSLLC